LLGAALAMTPSLVRAQSASPTPSDANAERPWNAPPLAHPPSRQEIDEARGRFQHGIEQTDHGDFAGALTEFTRAYTLTHNPRVLFNISATHEALGDVINALDALRAYETQAPADVIRRQRDTLAAAEARLQNRVGTLVVESSAPDVEIRLDGVQRPVAEMHAGVRLNAGRHHLALSAPGFAAREEDVDVPGNAALREVVTLVRLHANVAVDSNIAGAEVFVDDASAGTTPLAAPIDVSQGTHHVRVQRAGYAPYETEVNVTSEGAHVTAQLAWAESIPPEVAAR
jgi:hypothetical protein